MEEKEVYEIYGKAVIELEMAQNKVNAIKQEIAKMINSKQQPKKQLKVKGDKDNVGKNIHEYHK